MPKPLVYISRKIGTDGLEELYKYCAVKMHAKPGPPARKEFLGNVKKADALLSILTEKVDEAVFRANPKLKIVANYAVGYDNIDLKAAAKYKVPVTNTPGDFAECVAEQAMALMLAVSKRLVEGDKFVRAGQYKAWNPLLLLGNDVRGKTLGIIGVGRIGSGLVKIAGQGFGMKILYHDMARNEAMEKAYGATKVELPELLRQADFISLHVPLLPATRHLIGAKELSLMKPSAILVNTARGPVIDEPALARALKAKKIAGAGLDVFEFEPKLVPGLSRLSNVVLTPHIASATYAARQEMARIASDNILDVLVRGVRPRNEIKA